MIFANRQTTTRGWQERSRLAPYPGYDRMRNLASLVVRDFELVRADGCLDELGLPESFLI
jgi:hypothetical protein